MNPYATTQSRVLQAVERAGRYRCESQAEQRAALKLNAKGLVRRDAKDGALWYPAAPLPRVARRVSSW